MAENASRKGVLSVAIAAALLVALASAALVVWRHVAFLTAERARLECQLSEVGRQLSEMTEKYEILQEQVHELDDFNAVKAQGLLGLGESVDNAEMNKAKTEAEIAAFNESRQTLCEPKTDGWMGDLTIERDSRRTASFSFDVYPGPKADMERIFAKMVEKMAAEFKRSNLKKVSDTEVRYVEKQPDGDTFSYVLTLGRDANGSDWKVNYLARSSKLMKIIVAREAKEKTEKAKDVK